MKNYMKIKNKTLVITSVVMWLIILFIVQLKLGEMIGSSEYKGLENIYMIQTIITKLIPMILFTAITSFILKDSIKNEGLQNKDKIILHWSIIAFLILSLNELVYVLFINTSVRLNSSMDLQTVIQNIKGLKTVYTGLESFIPQSMKGTLVDIVAGRINIFSVLAFIFLYFTTNKLVKNVLLTLSVLFIVYIVLFSGFGLIDIFSIVSWS